MAKLAEHFVEIGARIEKFKAAMAQVEKRSVEIGKKMSALGKKMTMRVTLPLIAVGVAAVKMGADFDKAMTESLAIMGDVSVAMRTKMAAAAKEMSTKTTFAAKELAEAYFFLASAGMNAVQSIKALPVVAKFAQAGAFNLATATDLLTDAQTALGLSSEDAVENQRNLIKVSDVLVKANTLANASVLQFSESLTNRAAAALVNVNKSMEEGVAVLAAYADKGVKGQIAGMRLAMMLNALDVAARKNKKAWEAQGLSLFDAQGEMKDVADIIGDLEVALGGLTTEQRAATLASLGFNIRTKASILTLMGSSEKIRQWTKDLKEAGGTTEIVAKKQLQAFSNQMKIFWNSLVKVGMQIGDILIPIIKDLVDNHLRPAIERFSKLSEGTKKMILVVVGLVAGLGPLLVIFGKVLTILPKLRLALATTTGHIGLMMAAAVALGAVLNTLIDNYSKKQDAELAAMIKTASPMVQAMALRKKLIEDEILTIKQWSEIFNKHGRSYKRVMKAISTLPEHAHIKAKWEEMQEAQKKTGSSAKDLADKFKNDVAKALGLVAEKTKAWIDYLHELGFKTIKEKQERVAELTKYLGNLHQAYEDGKIGLREYTEATKATKDELKEIAEESKNAAIAIRASLANLPGSIIPPTAFELTKMSFENLEAFIKQWTEKYYERLEEMKARFMAIFSNMAYAISNFFYQIGALSQVRYDKELTAIDRNYQAQKDAIENSTMGEKKKADALEKLNADYEAKKGAIQKKAFESQKKISLITAAINIAEAVTKALTAAPPPWNLILAGITAAAGAIQLAAISAQSFPGLEKGGLIPKPMLVEAGHGPKGEIIAQPAMLAKIIAQEMPKLVGALGIPGMSPQKIILPLTVQIGGEKYEEQIVYIVKKRAKVGDITFPHKAVI